MERFPKLATPELAATMVVPERVPPPAFVPMAMVMLALEPVTVLLKVSSTVTWTAGAMEEPAATFEGWTVKASFEAAAGEMLNVLEVAAVRAPELAVNV